MNTFCSKLHRTKQISSGWSLWENEWHYLIKSRRFKHISYTACNSIEGRSWMVRLGFARQHSLCLWWYRGNHLKELKETTRRIRLQGNPRKIPIPYISSTNLEVYHYTNPIDAIREADLWFGIDIGININIQHENDWLLFLVTKCVP